MPRITPTMLGFAIAPSRRLLPWKHGAYHASTPAPPADPDGGLRRRLRAPCSRGPLARRWFAARPAHPAPRPRRDLRARRRAVRAGALPGSGRLAADRRPVRAARAVQERRHRLRGRPPPRAAGAGRSARHAGGPPDRHLPHRLVAVTRRSRPLGAAAPP